MATLALTALGGAIGSSLLPAGVSLFGATLTGAAIGQAVGGVAGSLIDNALLGSSGQDKVVEGARLSDLQVMSSSEGAVIPRLYGRARLGGQVIWSTRLKEEIIKTTESAGSGKGGLSGGGSTSTTRTEYRYYANFALALCEGEINRVGRVWADGKELNLSDYTYRLHKGTSDQEPDSFIEAIEGAGNTPAYRDVAYIVFEHFPLERFGNRLPQLNFEVFRSVDGLSSKIKAVTIIPGAGEFAYAPDEVTRSVSGAVVAENVHTRSGKSDWGASIDDLQETLPDLQAASLIVSWFGTDLRVDQCQIRPGVENDEKTTSRSWSVAGQDRQSAYIVSSHNGRPAYGGSPDDKSVVDAIKDLANRNIRTTFYPFILMDVPEGNGLLNPYTQTSGQPVYPWRGRLTVYPAPGFAGTPDKTAQVNVDLQGFIGAAAVSDFSISGETVHYTGPQEWSLRRMVLHYAHLCKVAGGVDAFILSSELRGLTQLRDENNGYPFVDALIQLAADVKSVLGAGTKLTYAADWSEYFGHHPDDGSNDVYFHLDPLWSSPDIDAVGIDLYWPLSDWRDGGSHVDLTSGVPSQYDMGYLRGNVGGGEGYDWYYQSQSDRDNQNRTSITDGGGKPWLFRYKDVYGWWSNQHYNRPNGVESATPTGWVPESKPFWFTEFGCPAVDKGANQPNVFPDPKSSESANPYYSSGARDDTIQRRYIQAILEYFDTEGEEYISGSNPVSSVYGSPMVDLGNAYVYTWDARPFPAFPYNADIWGDAANWTMGHWLSGRIGDAPLAQTVMQIFEDFGFADYDASSLYGSMQGVVLDRIMSVREALQPLELAFFMDAFESDGRIEFRHRGQLSQIIEVVPDQLVEHSPEKDLYAVTRRQETELPAIAKLSYTDSRSEYRPATVDARRRNVKSQRTATARLPLVLEQSHAVALSGIWLQDIWASREQATFSLPPSFMHLEPTDRITLDTAAGGVDLRVTSIEDMGHRSITAQTIEPAIYQRIPTAERAGASETPVVYGEPTVVFLDLPYLEGMQSPALGHAAVWQDPWPGAVSCYASPDSSGFQNIVDITAPATTGVLLTDLEPGPVSRWDRGASVDVQLYKGELISVEDLKLFNGANLAAIETDAGKWEVIQFRNAELIAERTYRLSYLLRGQGGTELYVQQGASSGARFLALDGAVTPVPLGLGSVNLPLNWKVGPSNKTIDHSSYASLTHSFSGQGHRPFSPVHISSEWRNGDLDISWVRRSRLGGDSWELSEVPLGEDVELYEIEIMDGEDIKRTIISSIPSATYSSVQQIEDWGAPEQSYAIRIYQVSASVGRGYPGEAVIGDIAP